MTRLARMISSFGMTTSQAVSPRLATIMMPSQIPHDPSVRLQGGAISTQQVELFFRPIYNSQNTKASLSYYDRNVMQAMLVIAQVSYLSPCTDWLPVPFPISSILLTYLVSTHTTVISPSEFSTRQTGQCGLH